MTAGEIERHALMDLNRGRLEELAWRGIHIKSLKPREFFVICIHVDDPEWTHIVDHLMPGADWQQYRDRGEHPVARGSVLREGMGEYLSKVCPAIAPAFIDLSRVSEQLIHVVVLAAGGASVYEVEPREEPN